jgi:hypothetical protein
MVNTRLREQFLSENVSAVRLDSSILAGRFCLDSAFTKYTEQITPDCKLLSFVEISPGFVFAHNQTWDFRAGLGYERIEGTDLHHGIKGSYRVRWFHKPFQLGLDLGYTGGLGNNQITEIAPYGAFHWKNCEFGLGYRNRRISHEDLQGPEVSFGIWF